MERTHKNEYLSDLLIVILIYITIQENHQANMNYSQDIVCSAELFSLYLSGEWSCLAVSIQGYSRFVWFRTFEHNFPLLLLQTVREPVRELPRKEGIVCLGRQGTIRKGTNGRTRRRAAI